MKKKFFKVEIITPFEILCQDQVKHLRAPGTKGLFGIKAGHAPFIATLGIGEIKLELEKETKYFATSGGIIEVLPYLTTILVETAEEANAIDVERALLAKEKAEERFDEKEFDIDLELARDALRKAKNRVKIAEKFKTMQES